MYTITVYFNNVGFQQWKDALERESNTSFVQACGKNLKHKALPHTTIVVGLDTSGARAMDSGF